MDPGYGLCNSEYVPPITTATYHESHLILARYHGYGISTTYIFSSGIHGLIWGSFGGATPSYALQLLHIDTLNVWMFYPIKSISSGSGVYVSKDILHCNLILAVLFIGDIQKEGNRKTY